MLHEKIHSVRATLGGLAGRVSPQVWEELRPALAELADAEDQAGRLEAVLRVPRDAVQGLARGVGRCPVHSGIDA